MLSSIVKLIAVFNKLVAIALKILQRLIFRRSYYGRSPKYLQERDRLFKYYLFREQ
jgi:hypothetical protein